jgi:hypothetical protein
MCKLIDYKYSFPELWFIFFQSKILKGFNVNNRRYNRRTSIVGKQESVG